MPEGNPLPLDLVGQHFLYSEQGIQSPRGARVCLPPWSSIDASRKPHGTVP